jgi:hypothetical protein
MRQDVQRWATPAGRPMVALRRGATSRSVKSPLSSPRAALLPDALLLALLALFCLRLLAPLELARDLTLWDEADYLRRAFALPQRGLPAPEWGPLHSLFYFALSRLVPDPITLHDVAYRLLAVLPTLGIYLCARRAGAPRTLSLLGSALFLVSAAPHVAPRPTLLALVLVLAGLWVALGRRSLAGAAASLGLSLLLASFARPELFMSFLLVSGVLGLALLRGGWRQSARTAFTYAALALALVALLGNPFEDRSGRRLYAFCQHYALGEVARAKLDVEPWGQCNAVLRRSFGEVHSVGEAARANPSAFLTHLRANLLLYPVASLHLFLRGPSHADLLDPQPRPWTPERQGHALLVGLSLLGLAGLLLRRGGPQLRLALRSPAVVRCGLALLLVLIPSALSSLLLHPRDHYLVLQGVLLPLFVLVLAAALAPPRAESQGGVAFALALALLIAAPMLGPATGAPLPHRRAVAQLRPVAAALPGSFGLLETLGGYDVYLGRRVSQVLPSQRRPGEAFEDFLARRNVRMVLLEPSLTGHALLAGDADFQAFVAAPEAFGFRVAPLGDTGIQVAVREREPQRTEPALERASLKRAP